MIATTALTSSLSLFGGVRFSILDCLVDGENEASCFTGTRKGVLLDESRFPDELFVSVDDTTVENINTKPFAAFSVSEVLLTEFVEDISGVVAGVLGELAGNDFQGTSETADDDLLLATDCAAVFAENLAEFHFDGTTTSNDGAGLESALDDADGVVERAVSFIDELLSTTAEDDGGCLGLRAASEEVVTFTTDLAFFEASATSEVGFGDVVDGGLNGATAGESDASHVVSGDTAGAEDVAVSEVLGGEIADGELGEDDLGTAGDALLELVVDDLPLGVDDGLVLTRILDADFGVILLSHELEFDVQQENLAVLEGFGLLFETSVREGLLEGNTVDEDGVAHGATVNLLDSDHFKVEVGVEGGDGLDGHGGEEFSFGVDEFGVERGLSAAF